MVSDKLKSVMQNEGVVAIIAQGKDFPHVVNTWNSFVKIDNDDFIVPVGGMNIMEEILSHNDKVLVTVGSREVEGLHGAGAGFLLSGNASIIEDGDECIAIKKVYPWARAMLKIKITNVKQTA